MQIHESTKKKGLIMNWNEGVINADGICYDSAGATNYLTPLITRQPLLVFVYLTNTTFVYE